MLERAQTRLAKPGPDTEQHSRPVDLMEETKVVVLKPLSLRVVCHWEILDIPNILGTGGQQSLA